MTAQMPTRITIEVHPPAAAGDAWTARTDSDGATVHVSPTSSRSASHGPVAGEPRDEGSLPASYEPGPCTCLDDDGCGRDHANE